MNRQLHIIVADDDAALHVILAADLARAVPNATLSFASSGAEALSIYHQRGADLILSDCCMLEMSGLVLTFRLREEGATLPIVLMSSADSLAALAPTVGATAFVLKQPREHLVATVAALLATAV
jgi:CheY-like chemotaxis protein